MIDIVVPVAAVKMAGLFFNDYFNNQVTCHLMKCRDYMLFQNYTHTIEPPVLFLENWLKDHCGITVSYTHLDVYKRQVQKCVIPVLILFYINSIFIFNC